MTMAGLLGAALVVGLVVTGLARGTLILDYAERRLTLGVRHTPAPRAVTYDLTEGVTTYLLLLALVATLLSLVGGSAWVAGSDGFVAFGVGAMVVTILLAKLCPRGTTYWLAVETLGVAAIFLATSRHQAPNLAADFREWVLAIRNDLDAALLVAMALGTWLTAGWTAFWVLRRRVTTLGLAPMAIALAVEVINDPAQKGAFILVGAWIALAVVLLVRQNLARLRRRWAGRDTDDLPLSLGVHGVRALFVLLVVSFALPPLNTVDLSARLFASSRSQVAIAPGPGDGRRPDASGFYQTGYTEKVQPTGSLVRSHAPVMQVSTDSERPLYWRGIDLYAEDNGSWQVGGPLAITAVAAPGQALSDDVYQARRRVHASIHVVDVAQSTIFWPGEPLSTSLRSRLRGDPGNAINPAIALASVDSAYAETPLQPGAAYDVDASYSVATEDQLRGANGSIPASVLRLVRRLAPGSRGTVTDPRVQALAGEVTAGRTNNYDRVKAIETYLRTQFQYKLDIGPPPPGANPVTYFLFQTRTGYCEYFASSMGELVRAIDIPVRLVNGYGPGAALDFNDSSRVLIQNGQPAGNHVVTAGDAHTWVEAFFPGYGWVPFEPTPDPAYPPIVRAGAGADPAPIDITRPKVAPPVAVPQPGPPTTVARTISLLQYGLVLGLAILALFLAARVIQGPSRLRDINPAWRRLGWLGVRLGVTRADTDTSLEFAHALSLALPELAAEARQLAWIQNRAWFSKDGLQDVDRERAEVAWKEVRARLLRTLLLGPWRNFSREAPAPRLSNPRP